MAAQTVKVMTLAQARALVQGGQEIRPGTYALRAQGVTITLKRDAASGMVRAVIMRGCDC